MKRKTKDNKKYTFFQKLQEDIDEVGDNIVIMKDLNGQQRRKIDNRLFINKPLQRKPDRKRTDD